MKLMCLLLWYVCFGIFCSHAKHIIPYEKETRILPSSAFVDYNGRIDFTDRDHPKFSSPGVTISLEFEGTECRVYFDDEFRNDKKNYYQAVINHKEEIKIVPEKGKSVYTIFKERAKGKYSVQFIKRTESSIGKCTFHGFSITGNPVRPTRKNTRKIEFIGNSISCGYGADAAINTSSCKEDGWGQPFHNAYHSFTSVLGRKLDAKYTITAVSGIGIYRNYSSLYDGRTMPEVYGSVFLEDRQSPKWDVKQFIPDLLLVELGTNDFGKGDTPRPTIDSATFVSAYIGFISDLRKLYPDAFIVCLTSPTVHDDEEKKEMYATAFKNFLKAVVAHFQDKKDGRVSKFHLQTIQATGCDFHPDKAQHITIAASLENYIRQLMQWND